MTTALIPVKTLKKFGGIRYMNAIEGTFADGYNFEVFPSEDDGFGFRRMLGNALVKQYANAELCGTFESVQNGTKYHFVYLVTATEGIVALWNGTNFVNKITGLTKTAKNCNGIDFNQRFFFTNGVDNPRTIEIGASPEAVTITCTDATARTHVGLGLWVYDNRIFMTSQYGLIGCKNGDETNWSATGDSGAYYSDFYDTLTFVYGFSTGIICGNKNFIEFMTGKGTTNYIWASVGNTGAVGHKAICAHNDKVYFFNGEGVYPVVYNDTNQRRIGDKISILIDEAFKAVDSAKLADIQMISLADTGENKLWLHARYTDYESNSVVWVFDFTINEWFRRIQQPINYLSVNDSKLYSVSQAGELLQELSGDYFNTNFVTALARLSIMDYGSAVQRKKIKEREILYTEGSDNDYCLKDIYDGDPSNFIQERIISGGFGDVFILADDEETYGGILADDAETYGSILDPLITLLQKIFEPRIRFHMHQMEFSCQLEGQNFEINRIELRKIKVKI